MKLFKRFDYYLKLSEINFSAKKWLVICFGISLLVTSIPALLNIFAARRTFLEFGSVEISIILFVAVLYVTFGYPMLFAKKKIKDIEKYLPDAFVQLSDILRSGGTYDQAAKEISIADYGELSMEMELVYDDMQKGKSFAEALQEFNKRIDSEMVNRGVSVITQSLSVGASIIEVIDDLAEHLKEMNRIKQVRRSETVLQALFIAVAAAFIAPAVFAFIVNSMDLLILGAVKAGTLAGTELMKTLAEKEFLAFLMRTFVLVEVIGSSIMISVMREGDLSKSIIYLPLLLLLGLITFFVTASLIKPLVFAA